MAFDRSKYNKQYQALKYDRIGVYLPKGLKEAIEQAAQAQGISVNGFIVACVQSAICDAEAAPREQASEICPVSESSDTRETQYDQGFKRLQELWKQQEENAKQIALDEDEEALPF